MPVRAGRGSDRDKHSAYLLCASWVWQTQMRNQLQNSKNTASEKMKALLHGPVMPSVGMS